MGELSSFLSEHIWRRMRIASNKMTQACPVKRDICAVVVTYNPDSNFPGRATQIIEQVSQMLIVDNQSNKSAISMFRSLCSRPNIHVILNDRNLGVATALNQGVHWAQNHGYHWVLLFDQDTTPMDFMVETLIDVCEKFTYQDKLAIIGSNYLDATTRQVKYVFGCDDENPWREQKTVITSGSLISVSLFEAIGYFRDSFFIDLVDIEYCLRARSKGLKVIMTREPIMIHEIGNISRHKLLWRLIGTSNHSAVRRYYMTRNHLVLAREYLFVDPLWVVSTLWSRLKSIVLMLLFEDDKIEKLNNVLIGVWHGFRNKLSKT